MRSVLGFGLCLFSLAVTVRADQLIVNGGFEIGGALNPWVATSSPGSGGSFFDNGGFFSPLNGFPTVGPASGNNYAVSDSFGPGTNSLSQSFTLGASDTQATLSFQLFVNDWAAFESTTAGSEQVRLLAAGADPLSGPAIRTFSLVGPFDVVGGIPNPYHSYSFDISADVVAGQSYQIDFVETDNFAPLNMGVDNVSITATPEPTSIALLITIVALAGVSVRRRYRQA